MKKVLRIAEIVITVILCIILLLNLVMIFRKKFGKEQYPTVFGYGVGIIISGSMTGTIDIDDMVLTKAQDEYHIGEIILFKEGTMLVTHRIVDQNSIGFITKGDANDSTDLSEVKEESICGKVVLIIPKFGKVVQFLRSPLGLLLLVLCGFLLIVASSFSKPVKDKKDVKKSEPEEDSGEGSEKTLELNEGSEKTVELSEGCAKTVELKDLSEKSSKADIDELNQIIDDIENGR